MSDISSNTSQYNIDKIIDKAVKTWKKYSFKDIDF